MNILLLYSTVIFYVTNFSYINVIFVGVILLELAELFNDLTFMTYYSGCGAQTGTIGLSFLILIKII